ncbi:MAG: RusA family crossover junction endodeoxyribonuclease [Legionellales bacterium]|nr:RusA family crossover junction endodeoxyribonuclease [Legionellales bacterium]
MQINIEINGVKPINVNNYQKITTIKGSPRKFKTKEAVQFESVINSQLNKYKSEFRKLNSSFCSFSHYLCIDYRFYLPFLTRDKDKKQTRISKNKHDVDNFIKCLQDVLFKQILADDSEVVSLSATKIHSKELKIEIDIKVRPLSNIL